MKLDAYFLTVCSGKHLGVDMSMLEKHAPKFSPKIVITKQTTMPFPGIISGSRSLAIFYAYCLMKWIF